MRAKAAASRKRPISGRKRAEPRSSIPVRGEANGKKGCMASFYPTHDDATERAHRSSPGLSLYHFRAPWESRRESRGSEKCGLQEEVVLDLSLLVNRHPVHR